MATSTESARARVPESREGMLKITEIFLSLQGEARDAGLATVFIRLTGCPLRCTYCDSEYAFFGGQWMHIDDIMTDVSRHGVKHVCVTGGEPLAQKRCLDLLDRLLSEHFLVSLETSGAIDISPVSTQVSRVLDIKTPASGEEPKNRWENIAELTDNDQVKFVIGSRNDYDYAVAKVREYALQERCGVLFSPSWGIQDSTQLAEWIIEDRLPVRLQMQLHKMLWGDVAGK